MRHPLHLQNEEYIRYHSTLLQLILPFPALSISSTADPYTLCLFLFIHFSILIVESKNKYIYRQHLININITFDSHGI